jgi:hypothetical protein
MMDHPAEGSTTGVADASMIKGDVRTSKRTVLYQVTRKKNE